MDEDAFFAGREVARQLYDALCEEVEAIGGAERRVTQSQIAFRRGKAFAWAWTPDRYLRRETAPLVLTFSFRRRDPSPRWKQVVEPSPGRFTHHLELYAVEELDDQVREWLREAWAGAANRSLDG